jgi:hypothetical protein
MTPTSFSISTSSLSMASSCLIVLPQAPVTLLKRFERLPDALLGKPTHLGNEN